jgi:hypothetical protein
MHRIDNNNLNNRLFPSSSHKEGEVQITRGCQTHGEAASTVSIDQNVSQLFELLFKGVPDFLWLPYLNNDNLTLPFEFSFETGCHDARSIETFNIFIHPCALPAEFCGGRLNHSTCEYYQPNMMARQLGCGQMPQDCSFMNSSNPERKSRIAYMPEGFLSMNAAQLFIPVFSHQ